MKTVAVSPIGGFAAALVLSGLVLPVAPSSAPAHARNLSDVFSASGTLGGLELEPVGRALAKTVASSYPVASASSSVTFVYDPVNDTYEREAGALGPIIGERAQTIGTRAVGLGLSYSYVRLTSIDGQDLGSLTNQASVDGRFIFFSLINPTILANERLTNFLPVRVVADLDIEAQILGPTVTYGVTADLDLNLSLPLIRTFLRASVSTETPDPRLSQFALKPNDPSAMRGERTASDSAVGVGDLLLRAKYVLLRDRPVSLAAGLGLSLPSGDPGELQGTGTTRVQPSLIASRVFFDRVEPLLNLGVDIDAEDVDRSVFRWAIGAAGRIVGPLNGEVVLLGRNELNPLTEPIATPFFFQIERNDIYDLVLGLRYSFAEGGVASVGFLVPLNDDGLRADFIPILQVEYSFYAAQSFWRGQR